MVKVLTELDSPLYILKVLESDNIYSVLAVETRSVRR